MEDDLPNPLVYAAKKMVAALELLGVESEVQLSDDGNITISWRDLVWSVSATVSKKSGRVLCFSVYLEG